jgi:PcfJ-like protein
MEFPLQITQSNVVDRQSMGALSISQGQAQIAPIVQRYPQRLQSALACFAAASPAQRDLLDSFPALALAAVSAQHCAQRRANALELLHTPGASLKSAAEVLGVPMWLKTLPPEALHDPLPAPIGASGGDSPFGRSIASAIPVHFAAGDTWLREILLARRWGGDDFAVWLARKFRTRRDSVPTMPLHILAAWAFFSARPETFGAQYVLAPWHSRMSLATAAAAAWSWLLGVIADARAWSRRALPCWAHKVHVNDLAFIPLETLRDLQTEASAQNNCVARYIEPVIRASSRLYSIRHGETRLATLEVKPSGPGSPAYIAQLKGRSNGPVSPYVESAVHTWLRQAQDAPSLTGPASRRLTVCEAFWQRIWAPYWLEFGASPLFEPEPSPVLVHFLLETMRACVQSVSPGNKDLSDHFLRAR